LTRIFFDVQLDYHDPFNVQFGYDDSLTYFILATVILVGYAIYFLCRHTLREVWLFILTLIGVTALALMLPDVIIGGTRSINARYLIPCYLGIQLAVAYLLANKVFATFVKFQQRKFWQLVMVILISGSVLSCVLISQAETWWSKYSDYYDAQIAHIVNEVERPLVIIDNPWRVLPLSYSLDSNVRLQVTPDPDSVPTISEGFSDIFIYNSYRGRSEQFRETIKNYYGSQLELVYKAELTFKNREISLWKLNKQ
jgi:uncharacterized membrane protein